MTACLKCGHDPDARVLASWSFHVPRAVRSGNAHVYNVGASRFGYAKERKAWESDFFGVKIAQRVPDADRKRRVTLTREIGYRQREYDRDNLATGCKPIVDALVKCGLLVDDSPTHAEVHFAQVKVEGSKRPGGLRVLLEDLALSTGLTAASDQRLGVRA